MDGGRGCMVRGVSGVRSYGGVEHSALLIDQTQNPLFFLIPILSFLFCPLSAGTFGDKLIGPPTIGIEVRAPSTHESIGEKRQVLETGGLRGGKEGRGWSWG